MSLCIFANHPLCWRSRESAYPQDFLVCCRQPNSNSFLCFSICDADTPKYSTRILRRPIANYSASSRSPPKSPVNVRCMTSSRGASGSTVGSKVIEILSTTGGIIALFLVLDHFHVGFPRDPPWWQKSAQTEQRTKEVMAGVLHHKFDFALNALSHDHKTHMKHKKSGISRVDGAVLPWYAYLFKSSYIREPIYYF